MGQKEQRAPRSKTSFAILVGMSTAILLAAPVIVLLIIGFALDMLFHTTPTITLLGAGIGFVSGIVNVTRLMKIMQKQKK